MTSVPVFVPGSIYSLLVVNSSGTALFHYMGGGTEAGRAPWERAVAQATLLLTARPAETFCDTFDAQATRSLWKFDGSALEEAGVMQQQEWNICDVPLQVAMIEDKTLVLLGVGDIVFIIRCQPSSCPLNFAAPVTHHHQWHGRIRRNGSASRAQGPARRAQIALLRENAY
jgi:hypothetical protein